MIVFRQVLLHLVSLTSHLWAPFWNILCSTMVRMGANFLCSQIRVLQPMTEVGLLFPSRFTITPRRGFANSLPPRNDVSVRADLRRIKWIRNFLQNNGSKNMSNKDVQQYLDDISGVRLFLNSRTCTLYPKPFIQILNSMKITYFPQILWGRNCLTFRSTWVHP